MGSGFGVQGFGLEVRGERFGWFEVRRARCHALRPIAPVGRRRVRSSGWLPLLQREGRATTHPARPVGVGGARRAPRLGAGRGAALAPRVRRRWGLYGRGRRRGRWRGARHREQREAHALELDGG